ncbi:T9SS-dependent choice-of-anchor J family protein [Pedobacter sp. ASV28]|uniref:T9SS-dependent choice-of-anchor J family protein n=1 Tax=Pedobacter sp. ASV28 TaxID=2795123 RepID=UPI0018EC26A4|nr:choice-of-anchor J domain-containing protein [Pedobacter sp. ASV28]
MKRHLQKILLLFVLVFPVLAFSQNKTYLLQEDFSSLTAGGNTASTGSDGPSSTVWAGNANFPTIERGYSAGGMIKLGTSSAAGSLTSRALNLSVNSGNFKISFKVKGWSAGGSVKVTVGSTSQTVNYNGTMTSALEANTLTFTGGTQNATVKIESVSPVRAFIDDVEVYYETASNSPSITGTPVSFGAQNLQATPIGKTLTLTYGNLNNTDVTLSTAAPFSISKTINGSYSSSITYTSTDLTGTSKDVYVKFTPNEAGNANGNLSITGGGLNPPVSIALSGTGIDPNITSFNFENCTPVNSTTLADGFTQYSAVGAQTWACTNFGRDANDATGKASLGNAIQINGYSGGNIENRDWLISPPLNLSSMTYPLLSFWSRTAFNGDQLQLKYSTNYTGSGNPESATWVDLDGKFPLATSDTWTKSQNIDLSNVKNQTVYIAFVYTSTTTNGSRWTIDDVEITNSSTPAPTALNLPINALSFGYQAAGSTSTAKTFTFSASNISSNVVLNAPANFTISKTSGGTFESSLSYTVAETNNTSTTVYAKFSPSVANTNYNQNLIISTTGVADQALNLSGNSFNTSNTLEVVNWNIEWFGASGNGPSNKAQQAANVKTIFNNLNADIYGLSEVVDTTLFRNSSLPTGYNVIFSDFGSYADSKTHSGYASAQKLAFMYRTDIIKPVQWYGVLRDTYYPGNTSNNGTGSPYKNWSSGRFPFLMEAKVLVNGVEETVYFIEIHAKANTGDVAAQNDSYDRRKGGSQQLKQFIDANLSGKKVIILGDFNDVLDPDKTIAPKPAGTGTSYSDFTLDQANYIPITLPLSLAGKRSTAGFNTVIDNVIINKNLNNNYLNNSAEVLDNVTSLVSSYSSTTTDHYPIQTRYFFVPSALPIELGYFSPMVKGNMVALEWQTKSETNNDYFTVERSTDGKKFIDIADIKSKGPQGATYQAIDENPVQGINYYRLKQTDIDGKISFSNIKSIKFLGGSSTSLIIYPNPVKNDISISFTSTSKQLKLTVAGTDGKIQLDKTGHISDLNGQLNQKLKNLPIGIYLVKINDNGIIYHSRFIKQ